MDIKATIDSIVKKIKGDPAIADKFKKDPEKTVEEVAGVDIPDGMLDKVVEGVKGALAGGDKGSIVDKIKNLF
ncbi:hypothetical protein SAMN05660484_01667 [Eubacterium ruminantium]|uniref:Uncharacterized protein n=1 Tax=Eubacterium ruminantium TaxID=42322 RepID=A0A1T4NPQ8_9FIRM|nr:MULTISPECIES: hypothetical protein [Eubacterium]MCR5368354.1 hypothetical protein [Eubacterium sp.]SCW54628.1 hypothetical protein SAMN05660484_01667 [Eubacterium ruminantium]SDM90757.1 hypothetical protein SAMN04490370_107143 [Eubacterium ruminantium]SJZ81095.1 hypothetical protein SAMN02745110_01667 [Eubacterium ruminantium]